MQDAIIVKGIEFEANHGYTAEERKATRRFRVNVEVETPLKNAAQSDKLRDTIDYRQICALVVESGTGSTYKLLEALAGQMLKAISSHFPQCKVILELEKLSPPCPGVPESSAVRLVSTPPA